MSSTRRDRPGRVVVEPGGPYMVLHGLAAGRPPAAPQARNGMVAMPPQAANEVLVGHIVAVARSRDHLAFAALFAHFAPRVKAYLIKTGAEANLAEDLAQEALLMVWRKAEHFDPQKAEAATWVFTLARNLRIDALRRERRPEPHREESAEIADESPPADEAVASGQRQARVRAALGLLPAEQARLLQLSFFDEKPHQQIARELGLPLGTVKSRLRLAMRRIQSLMGDEVQ